MPFELKKTINLPQTAFPMKANLPQNEPKTLERWEQMGIYQRIREARQGAPRYILHDGPPYTSGPIHMGTALNKCLKDFIVKSKTMAGFDAPYVPGWDCHGLPIEIKVDKELGGKKLQMAPPAVRAACRKYAEKYLDLQRKQFKRIGVFGRFERPYATMTPQYESVVLSTFFSFYENGFVYKGLRAVYWCMHDETALAEAEVEYENHTSSTVWVKYRLLDDPSVIDAAFAGQGSLYHHLDDDAMDAACFHGGRVSPGRRIRCARVPRRSLHRRLEVSEGGRRKMQSCRSETARAIPRTQTGAPDFQHPFLDRKVLGVLADYVTMDTGNGRCPYRTFARRRRFHDWHEVRARCHQQRGREGYPAQRAPRVHRQASVGRQPAHHRPGAQPRSAVAYREDGTLVSALLALSQSSNLSCHRAVVHLHGNANAGRRGKNDTLRSRTLQEIRKVKWDPAWGEERLSNMIETRPTGVSPDSVCGVFHRRISVWGCGKPLNDKAVNRRWWNCLPSLAPILVHS